MDTTNQFLLNNMPDFDEMDEPLEPALSGHPLHYLLAKERTFNDEFKEHLMPSALDDDELANLTPAKAQNSRKTYARRIIRATVPLALQRKAKWGQFRNAIM